MTTTDPTDSAATADAAGTATTATRATTATTATTATPDAGVDREAANEFAGRLVGIFSGALLTSLIDIGRRTGLFDAAGRGPATCEELAERAGLQPRYVQEWLGAMATGGIVEYEASTGTYWLPREHAVWLTGDTPENLTGLALLATSVAPHVGAVTEAFRNGGGVTYDTYVPAIHEALEALWGPIYAQLLVPSYLPLAPGLTERLTSGARVADVACGTGKALLALAEAFPASTFVGYDLDGAGLDRARGAASERGLANLTFEQVDAAELAVDEPFDVVFVFNAIHDQVQPATVLRRIHDALVPGGTFFMDEPRISSHLADNIGHPLAPLVYAISTLHCLPVSLAHDGAGLGTAWGEQVARRMLADAGFGPVTVHDAPGDPGNAVFITTRPTTVPTTGPA
ncbi:MAG TPA: class I SAM-dependent methyltransferase [Acidimicrobiales bacterium]